MSEKEERKEFVLPEGRLINGSLFVKDQFNEKATPSYKAQVAYDPDDLWPEDDIEGTFIEALYDFAVETWGEGADEDESLVLPIKDGDKLKKKREKNGKKGDAYEGKLVLNAHTIFNRHGEDGPGGVTVYDEEVNMIEPVNSAEVYNGCMVQMAVTMKGYVDDDGNNAITLYLAAVQKTDDGERLASQSDHSGLFKSRGKPAKAGRGRSGKSRGDDDDAPEAEAEEEEKPKKGRGRGRSRG